MNVFFEEKQKWMYGQRFILLQGKVVLQITIHNIVTTRTIKYYLCVFFQVWLSISTN